MRARHPLLAALVLLACDRDPGPACDEGPDCDCPTTPDLPQDRPAEAAIQFEADSIQHAWSAAKGDAIECRALDCRHDAVRITASRGTASLQLSLCGRATSYEPIDQAGTEACDPQTGVGFSLVWIDGERFSSGPGTMPCRVTVSSDAGNLDASFECVPVKAPSGTMVAITTGSLRCALR